MITKDPFGMESCEAELRVLGEEKYSDLYFDETPFNDVAVKDETYLIIGRRGSGKTALAQYFSFQKQISNPICIEVPKPEIYQQVLSEISRRTSESRAIAVAHLKRVWEFVIWSLIVQAIDAPKAATMLKVESSSLSHRVADLIQYLMSFFDEYDQRTIGLTLERIVDGENLSQVKSAALKIARRRPLIIAIDTLEQYDIGNDALMNALAALIEYAAEFNLEYSGKNIHLKVFVSGEVFPHLEEAVLLNPLKAVRNPVYLLWRPKDLLRLIGWRFYRHLEGMGMWKGKAKTIDWDDDTQVLEKVWIPHFGESNKNARGILEDTWPYVLRHTQMRPRQLIVICNSIAQLSIQDSTFPFFRNDHIIDGIKKAELKLSREILNSFSEIYPGVERIVSALSRLPKVFNGNELDKRASQSAAEWPREYSPSRFKQLVAELGIVGRVTRGNHETDYIDADFEYSSTERLMLTHRDICVVHPMFYQKLSIAINSEARVMPFTTKRG
jgi:hypothetical protein